MSRALWLTLVFACGSACSGTCGPPGSSTSAFDAAPSVAQIEAGTRSPAQIRAEGNHLTGAGSLYLRMHANNPVDWYPWGAEALDRARALDRPIFLSIGYASCHWCHVMEEEVFSKDDAALYLNEHFVAIKVDREERPDLDALYIDAVQSMVGSAGWPLTVFLTPSKKPFFGGTYFPHAQFIQIAQQGAEQFASKRSEVEARGSEVHARISKQAAPSAAPRVRGEEILAIARRAADDSDPTWGGFRGRMKFPNPVKWTLLSGAYRKGGDPAIETALRRTLDQMASGGIHDAIGGGFHRYAVDQKWLVPHFEKMLYVNAELATEYLGAAAALNDARYLEVAKDTLDFLLRDMRAEDGAFAASLDADSGGAKLAEGSYYVFTPGELRAVAGAGDGKALATLLGATDAGNFEGSNVLTRRSPEDAALAPVLAKWRPGLLSARDKRAHPRLDTKVVTSWNGMVISALAHGYAATGDGRYLEAATKAASFISRAHRSNGALARASNGGHAEGSAGLDDYAALAAGYVDLFDATFELPHLEVAIALVEEANGALASPEGAWYASAVNATNAVRRIELFDSEEPAGYATMLAVLVRIASLTGRATVYAALDRALGAYAEAARNATIGMAGTLTSALIEAGPFYDVVIAGPPEDARTRALLATYRAVGPIWATLVTIPEAGASPPMARAIPALVGKTGRAGAPVAYVCVRGACKLPTSDPATLRKQVLEGWSK